VEVALTRELAAMDGADSAFHDSLAEMAVRLARAYDGYDGHDLTKLARLNQELRQTLAALVEVGVDDDSDEGARLSTPVFADVPAAVRDAAQPGPADVGAAGGGGGGGSVASTGPAADAASAADLGRGV
jgi:hypothetical protein